MDVAVGWFADPIYLGHYPESMEKMLGDRLPKFTEKELTLLEGSSEVSDPGDKTTLMAVLRYECRWSGGSF
jgi:beta-glucosidase